MWKVLALGRARTHRAVGIDRKEAVDVAQDRSLLAQMFVYVARTLIPRAPDLFVQAKKRGVTSLANCAVKRELTPGLVVRKDFLEVNSRRRVAFVLARMLAHAPRAHCKLALPTTVDSKAAPSCPRSCSPAPRSPSASSPTRSRPSSPSCAGSVAAPPRG